MAYDPFFQGGIHMQDSFILLFDITVGFFAVIGFVSFVCCLFDAVASVRERPKTGGYPPALIAVRLDGISVREAEKLVAGAGRGAYFSSECGKYDRVVFIYEDARYKSYIASELSGAFDEKRSAFVPAEKAGDIFDFLTS